MIKFLMKKCIVLLLAVTIFGAANAQVRRELAKTPPMGWNSWNFFGKQDINEKIVREVIDAMVSTGLRDAGYNYVVIDGGWRDVKLAPDGGLLAHPEKFPNGIKPLADYAHSKGLKFGLHTVPGTHDCGGNPVGGLGHEEVQIKQFVDWGIDFIKLDKCRLQGDPCDTCPKGRTGWSEETVDKLYKKWSRLLYNSGRKILFSVSAYKFRDWNPKFSNMSRTTFDIYSNRQKEGAVFEDHIRQNNKSFLSVMGCAEINDESAKYAGNGYWNDPDMMVTGNRGLTKNEQASHVALWAIINAPFILGNDPRNMSTDEKDLVLNKEIIAINQDNSPQGRLVKKTKDYQIWKKKMKDGSTTLLLLNLNEQKPLKVTANFKELGIPSTVKVRDVMSKKNLGTAKNSFSQTLATHESILVRLKK